MNAALAGYFVELLNAALRKSRIARVRTGSKADIDELGADVREVPIGDTHHLRTGNERGPDLLVRAFLTVQKRLIGVAEIPSCCTPAVSLAGRCR